MPYLSGQNIFKKEEHRTVLVKYLVDSFLIFFVKMSIIVSINFEVFRHFMYDFRSL